MFVILMAEQIAQKSLIRTTYFASPEYISIVSAGEYGDDESWRTEEHHSDDNRDTLSEWLLQNTLHKIPEDDSFDNRIVAGKLRLLMGENAVLCEIVFEPVYDGKRREQIGETKKSRCGHRSWKYKEPYRKILRIKSIPSSKELPPELLETLTEREYYKVRSEDNLVKQSFGVKV